MRFSVCVLGLLVVCTSVSLNAALAESGATFASQQQSPSLPLVPPPASLKATSGSLTLTDASRVVADDAKLSPLASVLAREIYQATGLQLATAAGAPRAGDVVLKLDAELHGETHAVDVNDRATVRGGNYGAVALGTASVLQLLQVDGKAVSLPHVAFIDTPASKYRGVMMDVARRYSSIDELRQLVVLCRLYKMNYLHLHLTDDQTFAFPSTKYPQLGTNLSWLAGRNGPTPYDLDELKSLVRFADERGVTIVPELEGPGHSGALQRDMPDVFGVLNPATGKHQGASVMNVTNREIYRVLDDLVGELCDVFPSSPYIHIGGDESYWAELVKAPEVIAYMEKTGKKPAQMHVDYLNRMNEIVKKYGKTTISWESFSPQAGVAKDVVVMAWGAGHRELLDAGYAIINVPWTVQVYSSVKKNYEWNIWQICGEHRPVVQMEPNERVIGAQQVLWERPGEEAMHLLRKTSVARAERAYRPSATPDVADFETRLAKTDRLLDQLALPVQISVEGIRKSAGAPQPESPPEAWLQQGGDILFTDALTVTLTPVTQLPGQEIRYTLDGSEPTIDSPLYVAPFKITEADTKHWQPNVNYEPISEATIRTRLFVDGQPIGFTRQEFYRFDYIARKPRAVEFKLYELAELPAALPASFDNLKLLYAGDEPWVKLRGMPHIRRPQFYLGTWSGEIDVADAQELEFGVFSIDGLAQLWIDGKRVIDRTESNYDTTTLKTTLTPGVHRIEFRLAAKGDHAGLAVRAAGEERWRDVDFKPKR